MNKFLFIFLFGSIVCLTAEPVSAQTTPPDAKGWHLLDKETSGYYGISVDKAYQFLQSKKLKSNKVIVAIIDGGADTLHEDLKPVFWKNRREIAGNGKDDDKNGYVDDIYGWNFLGGKDTGAVSEDSDEGLRVYHRYKSKFEGKTINEKKLSPAEAWEYKMWKKADGFQHAGLENADLPGLRQFYQRMYSADSILRPAIGKETFTGRELDSFIPTSETVKKAKNDMLRVLKGNNALDATNFILLDNIKFFIDETERKIRNLTVPPKDFRTDITKDDEYNFNARNYGNKDVMASRSLHGTHVSGIVAAKRNNGIGIDGVAENVELMELLVVPDGDEHDKDIALAIRYAVDNGAKIVNMSFGKSFSPNKQWIDDAVMYAQKKGVLLLHAAGNENRDIDPEGNESYPCAEMLNGKKATNWITVGASGDQKFGRIAADFSNYGKNKVDVFAPGVSIYSTVTGGNTYEFNQGTSMATPVVSGIAAIIKSYFPSFTPEQIKAAIEQSVVIPMYKTPKPGTTDEMVNLSDLCRTGGIVNAYEAVKKAYEMSTKKAGKKPAK